MTLKPAAKLPRGTLEQEAAPQRSWWLAYSGTHQTIEVKRAEHRPRRQCPPVEALVESLDHGVHNISQTIRARLHAVEYVSRRAGAHDRNCCPCAFCTFGGTSCCRPGRPQL